MTSFRLPAPAKINLGLRIVGRRDDGYHLLQTAFQMLSYCDYLTFDSVPVSQAESQAEIRVETQFMQAADSGDKPVIATEHNLVYKAAHALRDYTGSKQGARIYLEKYLPMGAGVGGGSSDAATALVGLNILWRLGLDTETLMRIALPLGADVPVFVMGKSAWAEGVGELLTPITLPHRYYLVVKPQCSIETREIFSQQRLTRDSSTITIARFLGLGSIDRNDCEAIACQLYPEVSEVIEWLNGHGIAKMTGTGSCVFCAFDSKKKAEVARQDLPSRWTAFVAEGLNDSPLITAVSNGRD